MNRIHLLYILFLACICPLLGIGIPVRLPCISVQSQLDHPFTKESSSSLHLYERVVADLKFAYIYIYFLYNNMQTNIFPVSIWESSKGNSS